MTPIEEVKQLCEKVTNDWSNGQLKEKLAPVAVFADTVLTILNNEKSESHNLRDKLQYIRGIVHCFLMVGPVKAAEHWESMWILQRSIDDMTFTHTEKENEK
jgi:hypothetical protein